GDRGGARGHWPDGAGGDVRHQHRTGRELDVRARGAVRPVRRLVRAVGATRHPLGDQLRHPPPVVPARALRPLRWRAGRAAAAGGRAARVRRRGVRAGVAATGAGGAAVKALAVAGVRLRRLVRGRSNIFFGIGAPLLVLLVLGLLFGGGQGPQLGVVDAGAGPLSPRLTEALAGDDRIEVVRYDEVE